MIVHALMSGLPTGGDTCLLFPVYRSLHTSLVGFEIVITYQMLRIFTLTVVISSSICLMLWTTKSLFLIFLKAGLVCCTYGTSLTSSRHSSSSSSGIGRSIRSESSSSSRDDAFSEGAYHCPRISGYYFGTGVLLGCRMVFRKRTLSSVGIGSWHCLKKDLGIPAKWEYDDVVVSTPTLGSSNDEDYVDWTEFNNGWEGSTHLAMHKDCHAIMVISHSSGFYIFHWGQHVEGKTSTSNDDGLFIRTVGYYFGQGEYQGCRIKVRVGLSMINTLSMTCPPHKDVSEPFSGKLTCWPLTSRAPSSDRLFDPFTAHKYSKIGLSHFGTDNDVHDYSIAVSDNALFLKLRDNASGKDTLFEWERFDLGILETPAIYPHPRTYGYYFGQEGQYQKCYFQFRDAGIKFVSMHCPRGKTLLPTALTGKRLMYGVEAYGDDPQYYKLALLTSNGDKDVFSLTLLLKHDSTMLRLSYYGYDEPFYFPWAPSIGEEGQPVGMPAPRENGYYSRDKKGRDVIR